MKRLRADAAIVVLACVVLYSSFFSGLLRGARDHDFLNLYTGASLALEGNFGGLYDPAVQLARERQIVPGTAVLIPFVRPAFYAAMLAPLALIPFELAFPIWVALQIALLMACWWWAFVRWGSDSLVFSAFFLPAPIGITHGQDCIFMLGIAVAAYVLADRERPFSSGLMLGLGLIKFHLWLLWPLAILVQKRWRMLAGYTVTAALAVLTSWTLGGNSGMAAYVRLLQNDGIQQLNPAPELTITIHALALNLGISDWRAQAGLGALIAVMVAMAAWNAPLWRWWAAAAAGSLLAAPHIYLYDLALMLLPLWLTIFCSRNPAARISATALTTPLPFLMTLAGRPPWAAIAPAIMLVFLTCMLPFGQWLPAKRSSS